MSVREPDICSAFQLGSLREFQGAMCALGYTRQWRYKRDMRYSRIDLAEEHGLRWCLLCGRDLHEDAKITALYCSTSCRAYARRKRRRRGVVPGWLRHPKLLAGNYLLTRELANTRAESFYLCHGITIEHAPQVCPKWGEEAREE